MNQTSKKLIWWIKLLCVVAYFVASLFILSSCKKKDLTIQQNFPFEVEVMPVPKGIKNKQKVEIRISIKSEGNYSGTKYFIRYFQYDGKGQLQYQDKKAYLPNDLYELPSKEFRLYYTSQSTVSQSFDVWISDNFGNEKQLSFMFNSLD
ncbi:DUF3872 domain-containing protein [Niabella sp. W65]|nr:DUF3872 domain-containing protein [Niabella sp. W65]MCH7364039.1 DUF3872 domain-containing protein [Niabella sp. W65]ULT39917.1 DUF3872 domain-containing protein [Niabella sp. I65]